MRILKHSEELQLRARPSPLTPLPRWGEGDRNHWCGCGFHLAFYFLGQACGLFPLAVVEVDWTQRKPR